MRRYGPTRTVGAPKTITPPCAVGSVIRACIMLTVRTVGDPITITSGGPTHTAISVARAAGSPQIRTVMPPGGRIGPPTCGTRTVTIGQTCMSVTLAAGIPIAVSSFLLSLRPKLDPHSHVQSLSNELL